ncbi:MAG TPA: hypothetical protein VK211_29240 [Kamptonema sp.]|nr:hypothetical protein [Kamptonema sp.]
MTEYYCNNCEGKPVYLTENTDPESPNFDKLCCPYCGSTSVSERDDDSNDN